MKTIQKTVVHEKCRCGQTAGTAHCSEWDPDSTMKDPLHPNLLIIVEVTSASKDRLNRNRSEDLRVDSTFGCFRRNPSDSRVARFAVLHDAFHATDK